MPLVTIKEAARYTLEALTFRQRSYQQVFGAEKPEAIMRTPVAREMLVDLAKFCRAFEPVWGTTPEDTARLIGRNEVWHRIMQHAKFTPEELYEMYGGSFPLQQLESDDDA